MSDRVVRAAYESTFADVLAADRTLRATRVSRWTDRAFGLALVGVGGWSLAADSRGLGALLAVVGALLVFDLFPRPAIVWLAYQRTPAQQGRQELEADEEGIVILTGAGETRTAWRELTRVVESPRTFVLVAGGRTAGAVPKRALQPEDVDAFRELARAGLGAAGRSTAGP